jgi:hypothetical protein
MKFPTKSIAISLLATGSIFIVKGNALAALTGSQISQLLQKQVLSYLPTELAGLINASGNINLDRTLETISKQGVEAASDKIRRDGWRTKTAGEAADTLTKDTIEIAQATNNKAHQNSLDDFKATAPAIEQTASDNSTPSESSLEAADKANNLNAAIISSSQRQIESTNNLTTALQITNTNAIRQSQQERVKSLRERVEIAADRDDIAHTNSVLMNRYYADGSGGVAKVTDNSSVAAFGGK